MNGDHGCLLVLLIIPPPSTLPLARRKAPRTAIEENHYG